MSVSAWRGIKLAAALIIAAMLQAVLADAVNVWGARPDLLLTTSLVGAMFCGEGASALLGFSAALIHASLAAPPHAGLGSILVSRTLTCFAVGWMEDRMYRDSVLVALGMVMAGTVSAECLFFLFDPHYNVVTWARVLLLSVLWNVAISAPVYYGIRALLGRHRDGEKAPL